MSDPAFNIVACGDPTADSGGLADMAPGPELGVLLGGIDISALTGTDVVEVLRARARQLSHEQAQLLAAMVEVGICDPAVGPDEVARLEVAPPYAADEIRAALAWTRRAAEREYEFAQALVMRLPAVFTALAAGRICRSKAWVFTDLCAGLTPDTPDNVTEFGRLDNGPKASAFPQVRVVTLEECGSHASVCASFGACKTDERALLTDLLGAFEPDMLVIADRNFYSFELWTQARETGADLLWRVTATVTLPVIKSLTDGSYRSIVINPKITGTRRQKLLDQVRAGHQVPAEAAIPVRVVEYEIPDREGNGTGELICLITSILDPGEATAIELASAYHQRWESETSYREKKTYLRRSGRVLRSKSPEMIRQEIWALLLTHYAIRKLMCHAADEAGLDPDHLSFMRSLRVIRRHVTAQADFSP